MRHLSLIALALATPLAAMSQTTVFSDNFTTDSSLGSEWYNMTNSSSVTTVLNPTAGQGLDLTNTAGSTGKTDEEFAKFAATPVTLATAGDYLSLTVNFNSFNVSGNTGGLLVGLYNTQGTVATGNLLATGTGGATADDTGYFGIMGFNTSAGTSTKFYSRQGGASDANELGYYSSMTANSFTQVGSSFAATGNGNLANSTAYTLIYTVTLGSGGTTNTFVIDQGATVVDSWSVTDASNTNNVFNELDFGDYGHNAAIDMNISSIQVVDDIQAVPEPSTIALSGIARAGLAIRRRWMRK